MGELIFFMRMFEKKSWEISIQVVNKSARGMWKGEQWMKTSVISVSIPWAGEYSSKDGDFPFADNTPVGRAEVMAQLCKFGWSLGKLFLFLSSFNYFSCNWNLLIILQRRKIGEKCCLYLEFSYYKWGVAYPFFKSRSVIAGWRGHFCAFWSK